MSRLLLTRPYEDSLRMARALTAYGIETLISPALKIAYDHSELTALKNALTDGGCEGIILTSQHAVPLLTECKEAVGSLPLFIVGQHTADQLEHAGFQPPFHVYPDAASLAEGAAKTATSQWVYLRGKHIKPALTDYLKLSGKNVVEYIAYEAVAQPHMGNEAAQALAQHQLDGICFYSERSVQIVAQWLPLAQWQQFGPTLDAFCLSPAIRDAAMASIPFRSAYAPSVPSQQHLLEIIKKWHDAR